MPTVTELMQALPELDEDSLEKGPGGSANEAAALRPLPLGRWRRLGLLGSLQAKIAAAYLFYWVRGWFKGSEARQQMLAETHWRTALRVLDSMSYLRGAVMKLGQTLANFPDIAPQAFVDTLDQLHFNAPPMHWSLLREMVCNELGEDPEKLFGSFEKRAFAAASLGQVHRATLPTGESVVLKIQYPGIARTLRDDTRNFSLCLLPSRLGADWESLKAQFEDVCTRLESEANYAQEAAAQTAVRALFRPEDGIVVPRVLPELSTDRIITMEHLPGVHIEEYMAHGPSQAERNEVAIKLVRAWYRMIYAGRMLYIDFHPGNLLILDDGRVGLLDFGMMVPLDDELWELMRLMDRALTTGKREDRLASNKTWCDISDGSWDDERRELTDAYADWCWRSRYCGGMFDFGDEADFREGVDLFIRMVRRRYSRAKPCTPVIARSQFGWRSILYRLKAQVDIRALAEVEILATGWDRSDYAPTAGS